MGIFDKLLGRNSAGHIKGRMKMELAIDSMRQPELLNILIEDVKRGHEAAIPQIVYKLGNALRHHAGLSQTEGRAYSEHPFMQRFLEVYTLEFYNIGRSLGSQIKVDMADPKYQKEIGILCQDQGDQMKAEARITIKNEKVIECFIISCKEAFDIGVNDALN
ncbi:hypothetical protein CM49_06622 [Paenibacillus sp. P1XP2]|nr:hypothetical protein CM49_06622 [Paenibacillus sp. P1XP2]